MDLMEQKQKLKSIREHSFKLIQQENLSDFDLECLVKYLEFELSKIKSELEFRKFIKEFF